MSRKIGTLSEEEKEYIRINIDKLSSKQIADNLSRTEKTIDRFIKTNLPKETYGEGITQEDPHKITIRQELRGSEAWKNLKLEFSENELKFFEESYIKLMSQFRGDVLSTEETQVFQLVKFEILMSRNLKARKLAKDDIDRIENMLKDFMRKFSGDLTLMNKDDQATAMLLENQIESAKSAEQSKTTEYVKLQERHSDLMKQLKATRDQRVKLIESNKTDFLSIIKMLTNKDVVDKEGRMQGLIKLAAEKEYNRLGDATKYEDGSIDNPILSCDTVMVCRRPEDFDDEETFDD